MSPVKYELGFYIPEDDILHSDRRENPRILHRTRNVCGRFPGHVRCCELHCRDLWRHRFPERNEE
jgi:hypothetical protein